MKIERYFKILGYQLYSPYNLIQRNLWRILLIKNVLEYLALCYFATKKNQKMKIVCLDWGWTAIRWDFFQGSLMFKYKKSRWNPFFDFFWSQNNIKLVIVKRFLWAQSSRGFAELSYTVNKIATFYRNWCFQILGVWRLLYKNTVLKSWDSMISLLKTVTNIPTNV